MTDVNPLLDAAHYLLFQTFSPVWVGFIVGAFHGISAVLLFALAYELLGKSETLREARTPLSMACALAGVCEPIFLMQLGTSFHDNLLAGMVLAALLVVVRVVESEPWPRLQSAGATAVLAGMLVGAAAGFKLTAASFAVAILVAVLVSPVEWKRKLVVASGFGAGVMAGFLFSNGYWMAQTTPGSAIPSSPFTTPFSSRHTFQIIT
jgi:hypothetical protein